MLISVDPGKKLAGIGVFEDGELTCAFLSRGENPREVSLNALGFLADRYPADVLLDGVEMAIERPQIYVDSHIKIDANDLVDLAIMGGMIAGYFGVQYVTYYLPAQWKGQVPKHPMIRRIKSRLSDEEKSRIEYPKARSLAHNMFDGIGIGLHHLGRLG